MSTPIMTNRITSLDGLRGIACLLIFNFHWVLEHGYGNRTKDAAAEVNLWWEMPWISWMYAGNSMIYVFFVISGYVLSHKPLTQIHQNNGARTAAYPTIASSAFRRGIRLFLPTMLDTFITALLVRTPIYDLSIRTFLDAKMRKSFLDIWIGPKRPETTFWQEMRVAFRTCWGYIDSGMIPWSNREIDVRAYDDVHWTIPVEFKCSMMLFMLLLSTANLRTRVRLVIHCVAALYAFTNNRQALFCFFAGMVLAETDVITKVADTARSMTDEALLLSLDLEAADQEFSEMEKEYLTSAGRRQKLRWQRPRRAGMFFLPNLCPPPGLMCVRSGSTIAWVVILVVGLYLNVASAKPLAQPSFGHTTIVTKIVASLCGNSDPVEATRSIGAVLITWTVANSSESCVGALFSNRLVQWLGKISFGIYLTHLDVIRGLGLTIIPVLYRVGAGLTSLPNPQELIEGGGLSQGQIFRIIVLGWAVCLPVVMICGHLFWYAVDRRVVKLSRFVEQKLRQPKASRGR
ncbi:hypothetical protein PV11_06060 [Exophiala sideris]|uniref:Acyltransferase 3 domain-containing protein n=1 Tax=Exophiala sideris TaxID=1016849 RepID=A0A0D1X8F5_9EURO|nr:hypothetical protein PV11_06060 [Exophiala sideris]